MANYYEILGVNPRDANFEKKLKTEFRARAMKIHPDRSEAPDAKAKFQELNEAYETLSDPKRRRHYDRSLGRDFFTAHHGYKGQTQEFNEMRQKYLSPIEIFFDQEFKNRDKLRIFFNDQHTQQGSLSLVVNFGLHNLFITRNVNDSYYHLGKSTQSFFTNARQPPRTAFLLTESMIDVQKAIRDWVREYATPSPAEIALESLLKRIFG
jgi:DnaJ-class molecular chaperone